MIDEILERIEEGDYDGDEAQFQRDVKALAAEVRRLQAELAAANAKIERVRGIEPHERGFGYSEGYNTALADVRKTLGDT